MTRTAAALVIGNEILTGKIEEQNVAYLARRLFDLGIALRRVIVCVDEAEVIAADLNALRAAHDWVFTSGGVGPTHDDVTLEGVARAFGRRLVRDDTLAGLIHRWHERQGREVNAHHLRMADVVEGAEQVRSDGMRWPVQVVDNVVVLPGVPEIFRAKLDALEKRLDEGARFVGRAVYTLCDEGDIAGLLVDIEARYPSVSVGSYPRFAASTADGGYRTKITFDGAESGPVEAAEAMFRARLAPELLVPEP